jgi:hypothetical protein
MKAYEGDYDVKITINFDFFYELIQTMERDVRGGQIEYPPWERGPKPGDFIKGTINGIKMWFMITSGIATGSIRSDPPGALNDGLAILRLMFERGGSPGEKGPPEEKMKFNAP